MDESFSLSMPQALMSRNAAQYCPNSLVSGENTFVKIFSDT